MDPIELAILRAWRHVAPRVLGDPGELSRRRSLARPPRAWCLAIRASDTRLPIPASANTLLSNGDGSWPRFPLTLDLPGIRRLCAPVELPAPGLTIDEVAARLGTTRGGLLHARVNGAF